MVSDEGKEWSSWGADRTITFCNPNMFKWFTACPDNGGWGAMFVSWEAYAAYEHGDQRREASMATGNVDQKLMDKYGLEKSPSAGYNIYLQDSIGTKDETGTVVATSTTKHFHYGTGDEATGWDQLNIIRNRAWGNLEVGQDYSNYFVHYNTMYTSEKNGKTMTAYPIPALTSTVAVPDAKEYYTALQAKPNRVGTKHTSEAWKVAVNEERRKEFNCEWSLCPDLIKSGYMEDHINYNYPVDQTAGDDLRDYPWSHRVQTYDPQKMDMPIPADEILKNTLIKQNPGY